MARTDEAAIMAVAAQHAAAWNAHDMDAYAALFAADADCVTAIGTWWHGRAEIARAMTHHHATVFRASQLTNRAVAVRVLAPDIALVHIQWALGGMQTRAGDTLPPRAGIITLVVQRVSGDWVIAAFQNTDVAAPRSDLTTRPP